MKVVAAIFKREFGSYFATPIAYVFMIIFLILSGAFTFYPGQFFARGQADLVPFFTYHPWLYLLLLPAISMRLWAEERRSGTLELLFSLPLTATQAVLGKFLASWAFAAVTLACTFPLWLTVNYLGHPDNGVIALSYLASLLMAGAFLAIGASMSALSRNQVIAFVLSAALGLAFVLSGYPLVLDLFDSWAPGGVVRTVASLSILTHFTNITRGVLDAADLTYFVSLIAFWLFANVIFIDHARTA